MNLWIISLVLAVVVTFVVGLLLSLIYWQAEKINSGVSQIWDVGQAIASNTIHIPALIQTNVQLHKILDDVPVLMSELDRIKDHASECSCCPRCIGEK